MSKKNEVEFETGDVSFETPKRDERRTDSEAHKGVKAFLKELGGCWCGKDVPGCDGTGTRVTHLFKHFYNYTCPNGHNNTRVKPRVRQAAIRAGLVKEEDSNG